MKKEEQKISKSLMGKRSRASGRRFEAKVRADLEKMGWTVDKWTNTVDYEKNKIVPAKRKYNPFSKVFAIGTGFPDFICFKRKEGYFEVIGLEVKAKGYLDKIERGLCLWLMKNKIFSKILIAKKGKKRGEIEYIDVIKKYNNI